MRDQTCVPCPGGQTPIHWATGGAPGFSVLNSTCETDVTGSSLRFWLLTIDENENVFFVNTKVVSTLLGDAFPPCFPSLKTQKHFLS